MNTNNKTSTNHLALCKIVIAEVKGHAENPWSNQVRNHIYIHGEMKVHQWEHKHQINVSFTRLNGQYFFITFACACMDKHTRDK